MANRLYSSLGETWGSGQTLRAVVLQNVAPAATVSTDELFSYGLLTGDGYKHGYVKHSAKQWSRVRSHTGERHSTNAVESFWKLFKHSLRSTHIHVSEKYMQRYANEFAYRANHRVMGNAMFDLLIGAA